MASNRLAASTGPRPADTPAAYLSDLAAQLRGPRRRREAILTELRDGLEQATKDHSATGLPPDQAAAAARASDTLSTFSSRQRPRSMARVR